MSVFGFVGFVLVGFYIARVLNLVKLNLKTLFTQTQLQRTLNRHIQINRIIFYGRALGCLQTNSLCKKGAKKSIKNNLPEYSLIKLLRTSGIQKTARIHKSQIIQQTRSLSMCFKLTPVKIQTIK